MRKDATFNNILLSLQKYIKSILYHDHLKLGNMNVVWNSRISNVCVISNRNSREIINHTFKYMFIWFIIHYLGISWIYTIYFVHINPHSPSNSFPNPFHTLLPDACPLFIAWWVQSVCMSVHGCGAIYRVWVAYQEPLHWRKLTVSTLTAFKGQSSQSLLCMQSS